MAWDKEEQAAACGLINLLIEAVAEAVVARHYNTIVKIDKDGRAELPRRGELFAVLSKMWDDELIEEAKETARDR